MAKTTESKPQFDWAVDHDPVMVPLILTMERTRKILQAKEREVWGRHALAPSEFEVLVILRCAPTPHELTPSQIQDQVIITSGGLTKVIQLLEEKGFVERSISKEDSRIKPVRLTSSGQRFVAKVMRELTTVMGNWLREILTETEANQVSRTLEKIVEHRHG